MHNAARQCYRQRTLAHLLAAHSRATPKQAKEPIFAARKDLMEKMNKLRPLPLMTIELLLY
jgi:hypothetical protein